MTTHYVENYSELSDALLKYHQAPPWVFRGHADPDWELVPKAGRPEFAEIDDEDLFLDWRGRALEHVEVVPKDDWDWLAIAQHHGLATRLLDWSYNPLAAAFFAVENCVDSDGVVYAYLDSYRKRLDDTQPFELEGVSKVRPRGVARRITRQSGCFTIHGPADLSLGGEISGDRKLERIVIRKDYVPQLQKELSYFGISKASLFPDLDGLAAHLNWTYQTWKTHAAVPEPAADDSDSKDVN